MRHPHAQLQRIIEHAGIDAVVDVGANRGQYAARLREWGWQGPILSIEPLPDAHAELGRRAAGDAAWEVAPRLALAAAPGRGRLEVSAESDMSSLLAQTDLLRQISPSSRVTGTVEVDLARLDALPALAARPGWRRILLKLDVQGAEPEVLAGADGILDRVHAIQLELALLPLYAGERDWLWMVRHLGERGFEPHLFIAGYFSRALARQVQMDGVFLRRAGAAAAEARGVHPAVHGNREGSELR